MAPHHSDQMPQRPHMIQQFFEGVLLAFEMIIVIMSPHSSGQMSQRSHDIGLLFEGVF